jgi:alpha-D-ribose 1-methylphosphonate 5-triphosphate synthase subunit PhnI
VVVSGLFAGVFLTPAAYYIAIRYSVSLRGYARRHPFKAALGAVAGSALAVQALRLLTRLAD